MCIRDRVGHEHTDASIDMLKVREVPVIALWGNQNSDGLPFIGADNQLAAEMVTRHLIELGHTDIAFLFPIPPTMTALATEKPARCN